MSDKPGVVTFTARPGQAGNDGGNAVGAGEEATKYVTRDEALRIANEAAEAAYRKAQSLADKSESRVTKLVQERLKQVEDSYRLLNGGEMPAETREQVRQKVISEVLTNPGETSGAPAARPAAPGDSQVPDDEARYTDRWILDLYRETGVSIEDGDVEELKLIDFSSPAAVRQTIRTAIDAKRARLEREASPVRLTGVTTGLGAASSITSIQDPSELLAMGLYKKPRR